MLRILEENIMYQSFKGGLKVLHAADIVEIYEMAK